MQAARQYPINGGSNQSDSIDIDMKSKLARITGLILLLLSFSGCRSMSSLQQSMYEDERLIATQGDSYFYASRKGNIEPTLVALDIIDFWGKETIWNFDVTQRSDLQMTIDIHLSVGKLKICLVYNYDSVENIVVGSTQDTLSISLQAGLNQVVMVGNQAKAAIIVRLNNSVND